jgi:hypothetical protein
MQCREGQSRSLVKFLYTKSERCKILARGHRIASAYYRKAASFLTIISTVTSLIAASGIFTSMVSSSNCENGVSVVQIIVFILVLLSSLASGLKQKLELEHKCAVHWQNNLEFSELAEDIDVCLVKTKEDAELERMIDVVNAVYSGLCAHTIQLPNFATQYMKSHIDREPDSKPIRGLYRHTRLNALSQHSNSQESQVLPPPPPLQAGSPVSTPLTISLKALKAPTTPPPSSKRALQRYESPI